MNPTAASTASPVSAWFMRQGLRPLLYVLGLTPAAWTFYLGFTDQLGADPVKVLERTLGLWALRFLIIGLAITPLRRLGGPNLVIYRRAIGLLAFYNAALHLTAYVYLDQAPDWQAVWEDILKRPYITIGMLALTVLVPLAATSNGYAVRWLGARWRTLHKLVYLACAAAVLHFVMLVKSWSPELLLYVVLIAALLAWRVWDHFDSKAKRAKKQRAKAAAKQAASMAKTQGA